MKGLTALIGVLTLGFVGYCYAKKSQAASATVSQTTVAATGQSVPTASGVAVSSGAITAKGSAQVGISSVSAMFPSASIRTTIIPQTSRFQRLS